MKKLLFIILLSISVLSFSQNVSIDSTNFVIKHGNLEFYLDKDTNSEISLMRISSQDTLFFKLNKKSKESALEYHNEIPKGPYNKDLYNDESKYFVKSLTPNILTSFDSTLHFNSYSVFNQALMFNVNKEKWNKLEKSINDTIFKRKSSFILISGVNYDNTAKVYYNKSKIKIPDSFWKILIFGENDVRVWLIDNSSQANIVDNIAVRVVMIDGKMLGNKFSIIIKK